MKIMLALILAVAPGLTKANPQTYALQSDASTVAFETDFGPDKITGQMPVSQADPRLDF